MFLMSNWIREERVKSEKSFKQRIPDTGSIPPYDHSPFPRPA